MKQIEFLNFLLENTKNNNIRWHYDHEILDNFDASVSLKEKDENGNSNYRYYSVTMRRNTITICTYNNSQLIFLDPDNKELMKVKENLIRAITSYNPVTEESLLDEVHKAFEYSIEHENDEDEEECEGEDCCCDECVTKEDGYYSEAEGHKSE